MIGCIKGEVLFKEERTLILSVGGVGYLLSVTPHLADRLPLGSEALLWTHLVVREDVLDLYGFVSRDDLQVFQLLIGVSGIGPKSALNILSIADSATLAQAITKGEVAYLTKISGIGKKLAEKIILELREKMPKNITIEKETNHETDAIDALEALGYSPRNTRELIRNLSKESTTSQDIIRKALQQLGQQHV